MRSGYKKTEVGVIPKEWDVKQLGQIGEALIGLTYRPEDVRKDGTLVLRSSNIQDGVLRFDDNVFVETEIAPRIMVRPQDILICVRNGSRDLIGKSVLLGDRAAGMTFGAFMAVFRSPHGQFLNYLFQSAIIKRQIDQHLGATINQITNKSLNSFLVPFPPTVKEQRAIAEALGDVDALLGALDAVLAKKRDLKQAVMQQLLTGQTRLPGFSGDWNRKAIGDVASKVGSGVTPTGGERVYKAVGRVFLRSQNIGWGNLQTDNVAFIDEETHANFPATEIREGDVLLNITGASIGRCAVADSRVDGGNVNQHVCIIRADVDAMYPHFLKMFLLSSFGQKQIDAFQAGGNRQGLNFVQVRSITLPVPSLPEQIAIAAVLTDMDAELTALEARRAKTQALKQGMMQELLTGRTRLV